MVHPTGVHRPTEQTPPQHHPKNLGIQILVGENGPAVDQGGTEMAGFVGGEAEFCHPAVFLVAAVCAWGPAKADWVSGTITVAGKNLNGKITLPNGVDMAVAGGKFRFFLVPGTYDLTVTTDDGRRLQFRVTSEPIPRNNVSITLP